MAPGAARPARLPQWTRTPRSSPRLRSPRQRRGRRRRRGPRRRPARSRRGRHRARPGRAASPAAASPAAASPAAASPGQRGAAEDAEEPCVYGDNAYGTGEFHDRLQRAGITDRCKTQTPTAAGGLFSKDRFDIDLGADTVSCPGGSPPRSIRPALAAAPPTSGPPAPTARCAPSAPPPPAGARSRSAHTSRPSPTPELDRPTPHGSPTIAAPDQGRTQARAPDATQARRPTSSSPRHRPCRCSFRMLAAATNLARMAVLGVRATTYGWVVAA